MSVRRTLTERVILAPLRTLLRGMQRDGHRVALPLKIILAIALVPIFGIIVLVARGHAMTRGPIVVEGRTRDGDRLICRFPDLIQMYIHVFGVWEPDLSAYIRDRLRPGDVFIDVGANIGAFALLASHRVGASGRVIAVEASPAIADVLDEHIGMNNAANVDVVRAAASDHEGTLTIFAGPAHNVGLTTTQAGRGLPAVADVPARPLHALLSDASMRAARLVKIDVEGGEPAVLAGMAVFLDTASDDVEILVELSPLWWDDRSRSVDEVLRPFLDRGFHVYLIDNNYWPWRYLWPNDVRRPVRQQGALAGDVKRHDIVLSRRDVDML